MIGLQSSRRLRIPSDAEWIESRVAGLPTRWQRSLLARWQKHHVQNYREANIELRQVTESFLTSHIPLAASDDDLCAFAEIAAKQCFDFFRVLNEPTSLRQAMEGYCKRRGIAPPPPLVRIGPALSRMTCELWWRKKLRRRHGCELESAAIRLGMVSKSRDLYVSQERLDARLQQNRRNERMLDDTLATNEFGQTYSLSELASLSTSKKSNRRAELMTRIRGFDLIAQENNHAGLFVTLTCPSRFHRYKTLNDGTLVIDNKKYDPKLTPALGQKYLAKIWGRIRAKLHRDGIRIYGFRVSEPQHDATPHWHLLLFCERHHAVSVSEVVRTYALKDTPDEPGAQDHRCVIKAIDRTKGSAAGYIAKYIAKNIDGENVGVDFHDRPATESAMRVEAWASTWSIRQFQQIGGPTVSVWRELRRIPEIPPNAPDALKLAHAAANKRLCDPETGELRVYWDKYCEAQGGVFCGRAARIQLLLVKAQGLGRYGDGLSNRPLGVRIVDSREWKVHSLRHSWTISRVSQQRGWKTSGGTQSRPTWTRVNNCTRHTVMNESASPKQLEVNWSTTSMEGIQPVHPTVTLSGQGGARFEAVSQPPRRGTDVQSVASSAGATGKTPPAFGQVWGASPATPHCAGTTVQGSVQ